VRTTAKVEIAPRHVQHRDHKVLRDLGELSTQFNSHGRSLAQAVELLELSNRRAEESTASRQSSIETLNRGAR